MDKRRSALLAAVAVSVIWGLSFLSTKVAIASLPPMTIAALRFAVAVAVLLPIAFARREALRIRLRDLPLMAASGLLGVTLYFLCENNGIALLTASESSLVIATIPVLTMLVDRLALKTALGARSYIGALLSFAGVALIVAPALGESSSSLKGFLYMGGAALCWVAYALITKPLSASYSGLNITFWQSLLGLLGCLPFAFAERPSFGSVDLAVALNVLYLGLLCSAAGYLLYIAAMDKLGAGTTSVFLNLVPVVSVAAAYVLLGESRARKPLAGGAIAVAGVYLATSSAAGKGPSAPAAPGSAAGGSSKSGARA
jgi:drug/metabolite transporter (DMT)-like permease